MVKNAVLIKIKRLLVNVFKNRCLILVFSRKKSFNTRFAPLIYMILFYGICWHQSSYILYLLILDTNRGIFRHWLFVIDIMSLISRNDSDAVQWLKSLLLPSHLANCSHNILVSANSKNLWKTSPKWI